MQRAEAFMSRGVGNDSGSDSEQYRESNDEVFEEQEKAQQIDANGVDSSCVDGVHKPKVSTWGVFPRPDNISKAYGGGRTIPRGGLQPREETEEDRKKAQRTKALLDSYRTAMGIDTKREEQHRETVLEAIAKSRKLLKDSRPYEAVRLLESVKEYVSTKSELGGELHMELALALEVVGRTEDARELYAELRKSPVSRIASKAKQLSFGFSAMQELKLDSDGGAGLKVMDFNLPDLAKLSTARRYDTTYFRESERSEAEIRERLELSQPTDDQKRVNQAVFTAFVTIITAIALNIFVLRG
uniref:Transmembrane protein n=1 Tax=Erythrolobus madagascarensis TaxID=708628 RepID=A0A7S0T4K8_9RHOD|mmetsp:Transcript_2208/g.4966  ORF Transcript_2208/g.4966 Transcript_2208/m.4966 type:complete len:300 (+) Transcript_2208:518-1417(+)